MISHWQGFLNFLMYMAVSLPLLGIGLYLFARITPYNEMKILSSGADENSRCAAEAVAYDLGGKLLGLTIVLASAIFHSTGIVDLIIWGIIGIVFQVVTFYLFEYFTPFQVTQEIPQGNVSVGIFSSRISIAAGLLIAALIS